MNGLARLLVACGIGAVTSLSVALAQPVTPPPGMILVDCPVRPAPWQAPGIAGHPGWDLNIDPSSAVSIARGVPEQCIDYPGGDKRTFERIIGIKVYKPRYGTDPGSTTGALAPAVVICDLSGCSAHNAGSSPDQEWWRSGQVWQEYASPNGRWLYSVQGGLDTSTCDVVSQTDWRRHLRLVQERDLLGCLDRIWARGGTIGMPVTPTVLSTPIPTATVLATPIPAAVVVSTPVPTPTVISATEARLAALESDAREQRSMIQELLDLVRGQP